MDVPWYEKAICRGVANAVNIFFPTDDMSIHRWDEAYRFCRVCPVHMECLADALKIDAIDDKSGMYGGLTPRERLQIRKGNPTFVKVFADGQIVGDVECLI